MSYTGLSLNDVLNLRPGLLLNKPQLDGELVSIVEILISLSLLLAFDLYGSPKLLTAPIASGLLRFFGEVLSDSPALRFLIALGAGVAGPASSSTASSSPTSTLTFDLGVRFGAAGFLAGVFTGVPSPSTSSPSVVATATSFFLYCRFLAGVGVGAESGFGFSSSATTVGSFFLGVARFLAEGGAGVLLESGSSLSTAAFAFVFAGARFLTVFGAAALGEVGSSLSAASSLESFALVDFFLAGAFFGVFLLAAGCAT
jgi:hypothetical protein